MVGIGDNEHLPLGHRNSLTPIGTEVLEHPQSIARGPRGRPKVELAAINRI